MRDFALVGVVLCAAVVVIYGITPYGLDKWFSGRYNPGYGHPPGRVSSGVNHLPGIGSLRLSQKNILTRRSHAIQALGSTTVLCVDKTGTLTLNKMSVPMIMSGNDFLI